MFFNVYLILLLLSSCIIVNVSSIDPIHGIVRDFAYVARSAWDQIISQIKLPRIVANENGLSFHTDETSEEPPTRCPRCLAASPSLFTGSWHAVLWSRNFQLTTMTDLNNIINKIEAGRPIYTDTSIDDLLAAPPEILCPRLTVLNATDVTRFEFMYQLNDGRPKSIVGVWENLKDGTYFWRAAPTLVTRLCVAFATVNNRSNDNDFVIMNQFDSWPSCANFIAFTRSRNPDIVNNLRDFMEQQGLEGVFNKIQKVYCPRVDYQPKVQSNGLSDLNRFFPEDENDINANNNTNGNDGSSNSSNSNINNNGHVLPQPIVPVNNVNPIDTIDPFALPEDSIITSNPINPSVVINDSVSKEVSRGNNNNPWRAPIEEKEVIWPLDNFQRRKKELNVNEFV